MVSKYLEVLRKFKDILMMVFLPGTHVQVHINKLECRGKVHLFQ